MKIGSNGAGCRSLLLRQKTVTTVQPRRFSPRVGSSHGPRIDKWCDRRLRQKRPFVTRLAFGGSQRGTYLNACPDRARCLQHIECGFDRSRVLPSPSGSCLVSITSWSGSQLSGLSSHAQCMQFRDGPEAAIHSLRPSRRSGGTKWTQIQRYLSDPLHRIE